MTEGTKGWGMRKHKVESCYFGVAIQWDSALRICYSIFWTVWAPILRVCCGTITGKDNWYRTMTSSTGVCEHIVSSSTCPSQNKYTNSHLFTSVYFGLSYTPGKLSHWHHWEEHTFFMREIDSFVSTFCNNPIFCNILIPSNHTRQEEKKCYNPFLSVLTSELIRELIICQGTEEK